MPTRYQGYQKAGTDMTTAVTDSPTPLNLADRCDRCGSQAFLRATKNQQDLLFCGHHGAKNLDRLTLDGFTIEDFREKINQVPSLSSA